MSSNGLAPMWTSEMRPNRLSLPENEPKQVVCPYCDTWRIVAKGMIVWHRVPSYRDRRCRIPNETAGAPCQGSRQKIKQDLSTAEWLLRLAYGDADAARYKAPRAHDSADSPPVPPAVCQIAAS